MTILYLACLNNALWYSLFWVRSVIQSVESLIESFVLSAKYCPWFCNYVQSGEMAYKQCSPTFYECQLSGHHLEFKGPRPVTSFLISMIPQSKEKMHHKTALILNLETGPIWLFSQRLFSNELSRIFRHYSKDDVGWWRAN